MRRRDGSGLAANSASNLVVGLAALGYAVIVPAVVVRQFGTDEYGTWYLAFQVAAYILLLDLGSQFLVTSEAARPAAGAGPARLATAAMAAQSGLAVLVLAGALAWAGVAGESTFAGLAAILGTAALISLLASTVRSWYVGLRRAHVPAAWLVGARVASLVGLGLAVAVHAGVDALTVAVAGPQLLVHAGLLVWARRPPSPWARPDRAAFLRLYDTGVPLALSTVCGVIIAGVDLFVVRAVDPSEAGRYAIALPLLAVPVGAFGAVITAWMPRVSAADARDGRGAEQLTAVATTVVAAGLALGAIPFIAYADGLVRLFSGAGHARSAVTYLRILYFATCLRFVFLPWTVLVVVRSQQRTIVLVPLTEAATNLAASVGLGVWLGATGVALGTVAGAFVALAMNLLWALGRTTGPGLGADALIRATARAWGPLVLALWLVSLSLLDLETVWRASATVVAVGFATLWMLDWGQRIREALGKVERSAAL